MSARRLGTMIKLGAPIIVGVCLPFAAKAFARWSGNPTWDIPLIFGFIFGSFLTVVHLLPSASALRASLKQQQLIGDRLLAELNGTPADDPPPPQPHIH